METLYVLKLFVAGNNSKNEKIHLGLVEILQQRSLDRYELELVDVLVSPDIAKKFGVFATPTLMKELPEPVRCVVGKLDDAESANKAIELVMITGQRVD